ncbi:hypothetical protein T4D_13021 [Trichinella pseudospiralis]|uniref:Uncharacterized protein n=1 Tax=Trichinella pseudospiralis TaxID=6337 RepID=A0A0V1F344_TRIPS|nr:hypothetical protein T4D_13021 [Trichinella pseudospiralis]
MFFLQYLDKYVVLQRQTRNGIEGSGKYRGKLTGTHGINGF